MFQVIRSTETPLAWHISIVKIISNLMCICHAKTSRIPATSCFVGSINIKLSLKSVCIMAYGLIRYSRHL